ncbi:poly(glycerol-phosphate) alpha-glucosyltransferase [Sinorhizobium sp. BG8]|uniref:poly(glycerol-phosphate) alpha-glucosyltransferase n=1 Tax=Sinorhizobium sp. BG8 TaxID=2613773 RepID=UPI00193CA245|nr:poly(glycerol-phosphate) alpha-glucosyltransferase [Sinorhizobium sp. BG8]QRM55249.1 hypothetical protein F3Y30_12420 [Sinorhizobium sp. BG8]
MAAGCGEVRPFRWDLAGAGVRRVRAGDFVQLRPLKADLSALRDALQPLSARVLADNSSHFGRTSKIVLFLSASSVERRAISACGTGNTLETAWKAAVGKLGKLLPREEDWRWVKADLAHSIRAWSPEALVSEIAETRRNFFRRGIAFDPNFNMAFMEQELNGIGGISFDGEKRLILRFDRINRYLKSSRKLAPLSPDVGGREAWYTFETSGVFRDRTRPDEPVRTLISGGYGNGIRAEPTAAHDLRNLVESAGLYLARQLRADGSFEYGYFPVGQEPIGTYNILRHSSTLYSMLEAWEATGNREIAAGVEKGLDYVVREALRPAGDRAVVVDHANKGEIRLGAQAAFILAVAKYTGLTGDDRYLDAARRVAGAIVDRFLDSSTGGFVHVLDGSDLTVKEAFRIIFYDGEAVLALLRLHELDSNPLWLEKAKLAFDNFVRTDHWKHFDHWLAYCSNEITRYLPQPQYFEFGLKNAFGNLDFIYHRDTAYPTFLELLMASWKMIGRMRESGLDIREDAHPALLAAIHHRAEHLRYSRFYPEMAMYFLKPGSIAGSFFIRHHAFRVRIDDVEHFISGYCLYAAAFGHIGAGGDRVLPERA